MMAILCARGWQQIQISLYLFVGLVIEYLICPPLETKLFITYLYLMSSVKTWFVKQCACECMIKKQICFLTSQLYSKSLLINTDVSFILP